MTACTVSPEKWTGRRDEHFLMPFNFRPDGLDFLPKRGTERERDIDQKWVMRIEVKKRKERLGTAIAILHSPSSILLPSSSCPSIHSHPPLLLPLRSYAAQAARVRPPSPFTSSLLAAAAAATRKRARAASPPASSSSSLTTKARAAAEEGHLLLEPIVHV